MYRAKIDDDGLTISYRVRCGGAASCRSCLSAKGMYEVCPVCGGPIRIGIYRCMNCDTKLVTCRDDVKVCVTEFIVKSAVGNLVSADEGDTI